MYLACRSLLREGEALEAECRRLRPLGAYRLEPFAPAVGDIAKGQGDGD